jgi:hypothetical protein
MGSCYVRYFIQTLPVVAIIFSYYIVCNNTKKIFKNMLIIILLFVVYDNIKLANGIIKICQDPLPYVLGLISEKDYLSMQRPSYPTPYYQTLDYANKNLPQDAKIMLLGDARGLYCKRSFIANGPGDLSPMIEWLRVSKNVSDFVGQINKNHITHIIFNAPEAARLKGYDVFYWDQREFKIFNEFWKYIKTSQIFQSPSKEFLQ